MTDRSRLGTARQFNDENFMKAGPYWAAGLSSAPLKLIIQKVLSTINIQDDKNRPFKIIEVHKPCLFLICNSTLWNVIRVYNIYKHSLGIEFNYQQTVNEQGMVHLEVDLQLL